MDLDYIKKEFWICPVREIDEKEKALLQDKLERREKVGVQVHFPPRDTNQDDPIGYKICTENKNAIKNADMIRIYYNPKSKGSMFDLGMTFMADKPLLLINTDNFQSSAGWLEEFIYEYILIKSNQDHKPSNTYKNLEKVRNSIKDAEIIEYAWKNSDAEALFDFGMAFMSDKPIILKNREEVEKQRTPHKSFQNVLLKLDDMYGR
ncbi:MAG: hypothetical protein KKF46_06040 [Nanoarchaeota archaeon]|nr:hypothetical protein [Nanoarchaeota archaeon]MBU1321893.1 hypothetical protein [Nanoarchaeota archaeon]MBU1597668.1 hypothetical protein [Nanoarchaeota archaeon]MBU2442231.1 hypothetical protein [Nanoarchaeota archaeon]